MAVVTLRPTRSPMEAAEEAIEGARGRIAVRVGAALKLAEAFECAPVAAPLPPVAVVRIRPMGNGWAIRACVGGITVRGVQALALPAALWRFRHARREAQIVDEYFEEASP